MAKLGDETDFSYRVNKVIKVVDGDTIDVILDMGFDIMYKQRVRLFGIDTPESRTRDKVEKKYGLKAKKFLQDTLKKGKIVISDRYADSSFVYQGYLNKFGIKRVQKLHKELLNNFFPDYTFIFKINPKEIIKRLKQRKVKNKYDKSNLLFHQKVIRGYKKIANPKRYIMVDASLSKNIIHKNIIKKLKL